MGPARSLAGVVLRAVRAAARRHPAPHHRRDVGADALDRAAHAVPAHLHPRLRPPPRPAGARRRPRPPAGRHPAHAARAVGRVAVPGGGDRAAPGRRSSSPRCSATAAWPRAARRRATSPSSTWWSRSAVPSAVRSPRSWRRSSSRRSSSTRWPSSPRWPCAPGWPDGCGRPVASTRGRSARSRSSPACSCSPCWSARTGAPEGIVMTAVVLGCRRRSSPSRAAVAPRAFAAAIAVLSVAHGPARRRHAGDRAQLLRRHPGARRRSRATPAHERLDAARGAGPRVGRPAPSARVLLPGGTDRAALPARPTRTRWRRSGSGRVRWPATAGPVTTSPSTRSTRRSCASPATDASSPT